MIAGAGIGGLAATLSTHEAGHRDARVSDRIAGLRSPRAGGSAPPRPASGRPTGGFDPARLAAVVPPLRRTLTAAARRAEHLPEIPDAQIEIIRVLPQGTAMTPGELAAQLDLSRPTVSNLLRSMESAGLVTRSPRAEDRRQVRVSVSAKALDLFERFDRAGTALVTGAAATLPAADRRALAAALPALERLRDAIAAQRSAAPPRA
ncbi:MarR family transcriptional regulator [Kitasatospora sp. NPDC057223]|uniref:MarR family transcriptional regulator n=1 Tax=Kitasatospora sp. NPDC057223 TaxID=3346055 RepID=UPI00362D178D